MCGGFAVPSQVQAGLCFVLGAVVAIAAQTVLQQLWSRFSGLELPSRGFDGTKPLASDGHSLPTTASSPTDPRADILSERVHFIQFQLSQVLVVLETLQKQLQTIIALQEANLPTAMAEIASAASDHPLKPQAVQEESSTAGVSFASAADAAEAKPESSRAQRVQQLVTLISRCSRDGFATYSFDLPPCPLVISQPGNGMAPAPGVDSNVAQARAISLALMHILGTPQLKSSIRAVKLKWLNVDSAVIAKLHGVKTSDAFPGSQALHKEAKVIRSLVKELGVKVEWQLAPKAKFRAANNLAKFFADGHASSVPVGLDEQLAAAKAELMPVAMVQNPTD